MRIFGAGTLPLLLAGCGFDQPALTGGTDVEPGACGRGVAVVESDYVATNVSLVGFDGDELSSSFVSSVLEYAPAFPRFWGDTVLPTMPQDGSTIVLIDRFPNHALDWVDVKHGTIAKDLWVNTDYQSNPQDYVEISPHKAYVSRLEPNLGAGRQPFDGGSDVLVVDPQKPAIVGRIDLSSAIAGEASGIYPRPNRIVLDGDRALVLLSASSLDFHTSAESRIVMIDTATDAIMSTKVLDGLHGCAGMGLAPGGGRVAVACSGTFENDTTSDIAEAGLVVLARHGDALDEEQRFTAQSLSGGPLGFSASFVTPEMVVVTTFGEPEGGVDPHDAAHALHLDTGAHDVLFRSPGPPFSLGEVRCAAGCGVCFVADAGTDRGVLQRFTLGSNGGLTLDRAIRVGTAIGLPPRYLGQF